MIFAYLPLFYSARSLRNPRASEVGSVAFFILFGPTVSVVLGLTADQELLFIDTLVSGIIETSPRADTSGYCSSIAPAELAIETWESFGSNGSL